MAYNPLPGEATQEGPGEPFAPDTAPASTQPSAGSPFEGDAFTRGPAGPPGPAGMDGTNGLSVSRVESELLPDGSTTRLTFYVGTGSSEEAIPVTVDIPGGSDAADDFSNTVNITTGAPGTDATASLAGTGTPADPYVLTLMIPRGDVGPEGAHVVSASVTDGTLTLTLSDGNNVVVTGDVRGEQGISIVNLYVEQYTSPIGTTLYRNISTVIANHHNFFAPVRSNDDLVFPQGYNIESDAEQWTQNIAAFDNLLRNNDINIHELGGEGPPGLDGQEVAIFYADDENGTNASTIRGANQYFVHFVLHERGVAPIAPTSGYFNIRGPQGTTEDITVYYADDSSGTDANINRQAGQFYVAFVPHIRGQTPSLDNVTFFNVRGETGARGPQGIQGLQGPIGPQGNSVGSVTVADDGTVATGNQYSVSVGIVDVNGDPVTTLSAGTFIAPQGPAGQVEGELGGRAWDTTGVYASGDIVSHIGFTYQAIVAAPTVGTPPNMIQDPPEWKILIDNTVIDENVTDTVTNRSTAPSRRAVENLRTDLVAAIAAAEGTTYTQGDGIVIDNDADTIAVRLSEDDSGVNDSGLEFNTDGELAITTPFTTADETKLDALNGNRPIRDWVSGTDYAIGDQVLYGVTSGDLSNVFSVYIRVALTQEQIDAGVVFNNTTPPEVSGTSVGWRLMRSGLVRLQTNGNDTSTSATDTGAGLTSNATLRIHQGHGITISRDATTFHISQPTGTHDVDEFLPGWAYSYYDLENTTTRTGTVEANAGNMTFSEGFNIRAGIRLIITSGSGLYNDGDRFAFRTFAPPSTNPDSRTTLFPGATQDYIVYCQRTISPTSTPEATVLQVDPPVSTFQELANLMGLPNDQQTRQYNGVQVAVFGLDEHHVDPAVGTYAWAHTGNLTNIPTDKLRGLENARLDGQAEWTIDNSWLPAFSTDLDGLSDVTLTTPIADNQFLRYDLATSMWINETVDISAGLTQETTTIGATGQTVRVMDSSGVDFIAFALPAASATIGNFAGVDLYDPAGTVSRSLVVSTSNFENNPTVTATITNAGGATGLNVSVNGTQVTLSGIDVTVVRTITVQVTVSDGTTQVLQQNRNVSVVDNRGLQFNNFTATFDLAGPDDYILDIQPTGNAELTTNNYGYNLNGGANILNQTNPITIPRLFNPLNPNAVWRVGQNTINGRALIAASQPPRSTITVEDTVTTFRAFFFFASATDPTDASDFPVVNASTVEFGAGQTLTATEAGENTYYLAYPDDGGLFQYRVVGGSTLTVPEVVSGTFIRNSVDYQVFRFRNLASGTGFNVQTI